MDILLFVKEYHIMSGIISGVIGAIALVSTNKLQVKKLRAESRLLINNHSNRVNNDILKHQNDVEHVLAEMNRTLQEGFKSVNQRIDGLELQQTEIQKKFEEREVIIQGKFESLFTTVNQWLGNVDNLYTLINDTILPNIDIKSPKTKKTRTPRTPKR
jgi:hypothetical protein